MTFLHFLNSKALRALLKTSVKVTMAYTIPCSAIFLLLCYLNSCRRSKSCGTRELFRPHGVTPLPFQSKSLWSLVLTLRSIDQSLWRPLVVNFLSECSTSDWAGSLSAVVFSMLFRVVPENVIVQNALSTKLIEFLYCIIVDLFAYLFYDTPTVCRIVMECQ